MSAQPFTLAAAVATAVLLVVSTASAGQRELAETGPIAVPDLSGETVYALLADHEAVVGVDALALVANDLAAMVNQGLTGRLDSSCAWATREYGRRAQVWLGYDRCGDQSASHLVSGVMTVSHFGSGLVVEIDVTVEPNSESEAGQEWLLTPAGQEWLLTPAGQEWLQSPVGMSIYVNGQKLGEWGFGWR